MLVETFVACAFEIVYDTILLKEVSFNLNELNHSEYPFFRQRLDIPIFWLDTLKNCSQILLNFNLSVG